MKPTASTGVKELREILGLTQNDFAAKVDLSTAHLSRIENGADPSEGTLNKICSTFNVNKKWFTNRKEDTFKSGTDIENIENAKKIIAINSGSNVNPWQDEAYKQVADERNTLRDQVNNLTKALMDAQSSLNMMMQKVNFLNALDVVENELQAAA